MIVFLALLVLAFAAAAVVTGTRTVPDGHVGLVVRRFGIRSNRDDPRVSHLDGPGPQAGILNENTRTWLPWGLYDVRFVPQTYVPIGTVGLVVAKAGAQRPPHEPLAAYVECDRFQDGARFLAGGGQRGPQLEVLTSGHYAINPFIFDVLTVETLGGEEREGIVAADLREVDVKVGETGVVITRLGQRPPGDWNETGRGVGGHWGFQLPWRFLEGGGQVGVQSETLDEGGTYAINPWFAHVVKIPSRVLVLQWTAERRSADNLDASLDQIVLDVQGHTVRMSLKQTLRIPPEAAPRLVRRFGDLGGGASARAAAGRIPVQQFVEKELGAAVVGYFRGIAATYRIQEFITRYNEVGLELKDHVRQALGPTGVIALETTLEEFECDEPEVNRMRREIALVAEKRRKEEALTELLNLRRDNERIIVDIEAQKLRLRDEENRVSHDEQRRLIELFGKEHVQLERVLALLADIPVPDVVMGDATGLGSGIPLANIKDLVLNLARRANHTVDPHPDYTELEATELEDET
ncbi:SPFH domain/Band 7 family protein [Actinocorallia herbida]|uniref:SPFH domain/Band 7 family protein n=1 Tax=Actinocorallia herbida TaxID=58109 RepID=A0A3N1DCU0_9ACTN|nr:SPFH domain/Band 7 family protein [Actinocorallia herbida]